MLHPFLTLTIIGSLFLSLSLIFLDIFRGNSIAILVFCVIVGMVYYIYKPPIERRGKMEFWGTFQNLRHIINPQIDIEHRAQIGNLFRDAGGVGVGPVLVDQAHVFYDIFELRNGNGHEDGDFPFVIRENNHNTDVHNHQIQESLRESINQLVKWYNTVPEADRLSKEQTYKSIKEYLFDYYKDRLDKKEKAYSTIRQIEKTNGRLVSVNRSEGEILQMVWQRINNPINREVQDALKNNLLDLLADSAIGIDASYCLVGRITRMVQALQCLDKEGLVDIKSTEIIIKEIQAKIPVLRDEFFDERPALLSAYEDGNELVAKQLTEFVRDGLYRDYPQANTDTRLKSVVEEHLEALD